MQMELSTRKGVNDDAALPLPTLLLLRRLLLSVNDAGDDLKEQKEAKSFAERERERTRESEAKRDGIEYKLTAMNEVME